MLINKCDFKTQRHSDSLHFNFSYHCKQAENILNNNCIHIKYRNTIIFLNDAEIEKLEIFKPLLEQLTAEQLQNITNQFTNQPNTLTWETPIKWFNTKFGWFFKNSNKV